jgi:hypothetical protein
MYGSIARGGVHMGLLHHAKFNAQRGEARSQHTASDVLLIGTVRASTLPPKYQYKKIAGMTTTM